MKKILIAIAALPLCLTLSSDSTLSKSRNMVASWYDCRKPGECSKSKITASGEKFIESRLTAAHKSLPFGTLLKITNPRTKKSIIVRINDRGPYIAGREIDLSRGSAKAIGMSGVQTIKVEFLGKKKGKNR